MSNKITRLVGARGRKTINQNSNDYGGWSKQVAAAENVSFVDLNAIVAAKYDLMGYDKVKAQYFLIDHTHTTPAGAAVNADSVVDGLKALPSDPLANYLVP